MQNVYTCTKQTVGVLLCEEEKGFHFTNPGLENFKKIYIVQNWDLKRKKNSFPYLKIFIIVILSLNTMWLQSLRIDHGS